MVFATRESANDIGWGSRRNTNDEINKEEHIAPNDDIIIHVSKRKESSRSSYHDDNQAPFKHHKIQESGKFEEEPEKSMHYGPDGYHNIPVPSTSPQAVNTETLNDEKFPYSFVTLKPSKECPLVIFILGRAEICTIEGEVDIFGFTLRSDSLKPVLVDCPKWLNSLPISNQTDRCAKIKVISMDNEKQSYQLLSSNDIQSPIVIDEKWSNITNRITIAPPFHENKSKRVLICGAKNVGKSTFAKYLCNQMLSNSVNKVAFLDCDVGQPELSAPGILSLTILSKPLLLPPYAHMICDSTFARNMAESYAAAKDHYSAIFYGSTTPKTNPVSYTNAVKELMKSYDDLNRNATENTPLIINTDGWIKGMGYELLSSLINTVEPDHIVQILGATKAKFFDLTLHASPNRIIHVISSQSKKDYNRDEFPACIVPHLAESSTSLQTFDSKDSNSIAPSLLRKFRYCAYFTGGYSSLLRCGATFNQSGVVDDFKIALTLARMKPYIVPFDSVSCVLMDEDGNDNIYSPKNSEDIDHIYDIFNGSIVGLCNDSISKRVHNCIGLGIVRSIDRVKRLYYILTPLPASKLQIGVTTIVRGQLQLPFECVFHGHNSDSFPYQSCLGISVGSGEVMKSNLSKNY